MTRWVVDRLAAAGCIAAADEAAELVAAAPDASTLETWVERRENGEPLAWITGTARFCGRSVRVAPGVYDPRAQTEELARRAAALVPAGGRVADVCTGSGAVAVHIQATAPTATVIGVDIDALAVACARSNGVRAIVGDAVAPPLRSAAFDVVTLVAPYVPSADMRLLPADVRRYEPRRALDGGDDGLDVVGRASQAAARLLCRQGWLLAEVGGRQDAILTPALVAAGFADIASWFDDDGDLRGVMARLA